MKLQLILLGMAMVLSGFQTVTGVAASIPQDDAQQVKYQRIRMNEFQNFLVGWDTAAQPQRLALIRSAEEYDQLFQPAAVNGSRGPFAPDAKSYAKEQILLVGRQMPAPDKLEAVFEVESLEEQGQTLVLKYRYRAPAAASYEVRNYVALRLPAKPYERVVFIENGKEAGELKLSQGEWVKPAQERE